MAKIHEMIGKKEKSFKDDGSRWPELMGIEFELENVDDIRGIPYWEVKADNSLRNGVEYVLDAPYGGPSLVAAIDEFYGAKLRCENSARTSTHIHLNVLDTEFDVVRAMIMFVYMIEDALYNSIEEDRKWSGYSMPLSEMNSQRLRTVLSAPWPDYGNKIMGALAPTKNQERYYGFNFAATKKYGTVEFRYFPGGPSKADLESWLDLIVAIKRACVKLGSPSALVDCVNSPENVVAFLDQWLSAEWAKRLLDHGSAIQMFERFNEVAALCTDFVMDRRDPMMFITPALLKYVGTKLLVKEGLTYLEKLRPLGVISADEWDYHYSKAVRMEAGKTTEDEELVDFDAKPIRNRPARFTEPALANNATFTVGYGEMDWNPRQTEAQTQIPVPAPTRAVIRETSVEQTREQIREREVELRATNQALGRLDPQETFLALHHRTQRQRLMNEIANLKARLPRNPIR